MTAYKVLMAAIAVLALLIAFVGGGGAEAMLLVAAGPVAAVGYRELLADRDKVRKEALAIIEAAKKEERDLTEEEEAKVDELTAKVDELDKQIAKASKDRERERTLRGIPVGVIEDDPESAAADANADPTYGFRSLAEFGRAVWQAGVPGGVAEERLLAIRQAAPTNYHQETGSAEGYMVPPQFRDEIFTLIFQGQDVLNLTQPEPTESNAVELLADETTPWGSAGVQAKWRSEAGQMTASKLDTKRELVRLHELYAFVLATEELIEDAPRLNNRLTVKAADAIRWKASEGIVNGTGAGQPLGFAKAGSLVSQAKETSQAADTIKAENIAKMWGRLQLINMSRVAWLIAHDAFNQLPTMVLGDQPIWLPPNGFMSAPGGFLFGRPVLMSDHCETLGDKGDIYLADMSGYYSAQKAGGIKFASSIHLYFDYNIDAFRWTFRFGGQPFLSAAISPAKGSSTRSQFVTLDARA
jgi:HK97 family phage major capsid protein